MKTVLFHSMQLGVRGTEVAMYDYAKYNESILGNKSCIVYNSNTPINDPIAIEKFSKLFEVYSYKNMNELQSIIKEVSPDLFYAIKAGSNDGIDTDQCKSGMHVVFQHFEPHGDVYAYVAKWVSEKLTGGEYPDVPHMFDMPEPNESVIETRSRLNLPEDALIFGRHGGMDEFNLRPGLEGIIDAVNSRDDVYFCLVNTRKFYDHPQIIHLDKIVDMQEKSNWINSCDGMIHARTMGEIFSCSIGEFSYHGKPVLSYPGASHDLGHLYFLGERGLWYTNKEELVSHINTFDFRNVDTNYYKEIVKPYTPSKVMEKFNEVFIDG